MGAEMPQLLTAGASLSLVGGWGLGTVALALLVIGAAAICGVEPNDIPAAPQALAAGGERVPGRSRGGKLRVGFPARKADPYVPRSRRPCHPPG